MCFIHSNLIFCLVNFWHDVQLKQKEREVKNWTIKLYVSMHLLVFTDCFYILKYSDSPIFMAFVCFCFSIQTNFLRISICCLTSPIFSQGSLKFDFCIPYTFIKSLCVWYISEIDYQHITSCFSHSVWPQPTTTSEKW